MKIKPHSWNSANFMTQDDAESFYEQSMPRQLGRRCPDHDEGFGCTLFQNHPDEHQAWGLGHILYHVWLNRHITRTH